MEDLHVQEQIIDGHDGCPIAVMDFGGSGSPILLIHGAGRASTDWLLMAPRLAERHRVVAMDLRNHGRSGDGTWGWVPIVGDIEAVIGGFALETPALVGHSLGGMVAAVYADRRSGVSAVVNLDGHGYGSIQQHVGLEPADVRERQARVRAILPRMRPDADGPLSQEGLDRAEESALADVLARDLPTEPVRQTFRRSVARVGDGFMLRPLPRASQDMANEIRTLDLHGVYQRLTVPTLLYNAAAHDPLPDPQLAWAEELSQAFRRGIARDLAALQDSCPHVSVRTVDATHALIIEIPAQLVAQIDDFLAVG